ncbi:hypothetical protein ACFVIN_10380 [Streptomyces prasinus]|uniref:hypothetical protein n=1 Tax=Streptomyces prasinus TaxID=67345 RepID=UPI0036271F16
MGLLRGFCAESRDRRPHNLPPRWTTTAPEEFGRRHARGHFEREGLHDDLPRHLNQDLLLHPWPVLRTLVGRTVRTVREDASPQPASRTQATA